MLNSTWAQFGDSTTDAQQIINGVQAKIDQDPSNKTKYVDLYTQAILANTKNLHDLEQLVENIVKKAILSYQDERVIRDNISATIAANPDSYIAATPGQKVESSGHYFGVLPDVAIDQNKIQSGLLSKGLFTKKPQPIMTTKEKQDALLKKYLLIGSGVFIALLLLKRRKSE